MSRRQPDPFIVALRSRRVSLGMSQRDVAELAGFNQGSLSEWESGATAPLLASLRRWAEVLDCDMTLAPRRDYEVTDEAAGVTSLRLRQLRRPDPTVQAQIAQLTAFGRKAWQIAEELGISQRTVVRYRTRIRAEQESSCSAA